MYFIILTFNMDMTTSTLIKLPVASFRKIESPYEDNGARTYVAVVNVKYIPESFEEWRNLSNPDVYLIQMNGAVKVERIWKQKKMIQ